MEPDLIQSQLQQLEAERMKAQKADSFRIYGIIIGGITSFLLIGVAIVIFVCIYYEKCLKKDVELYRRHYKELFVKLPYEQHFTDVVYHPENGFNKQAIYNTHLVAEGNRYSSEDFLSGRFKDISFQRADVSIRSESTDSDGDTHTTTFFNGQWMIFEFNKTVHHDIMICSKDFEYSTKRRIISFKKSTDQRHLVEMESMEFNRLFSVYAVSDEEAFYVLTPHIMEALINLKAKTINSFLVGLVNNQLHFCSNTNTDSCEPDLNKPINIEESFAQTNEELLPIIDFIDVMRLEHNFNY